jgi:hypothetical protein
MSPFSARVSAEVLADFPEWQLASRLETYKGSDEYFVVELQPPNAKSLPLRVSTWDDEVTVDFDYYHAHFERWRPEPGDNRYMAGLLYVTDIMGDRLGAASWWQDEHCKMCAAYEPGAPLAPRLSIAFTRVRVRSWTGVLDADDEA